MAKPGPDDIKRVNSFAKRYPDIVTPAQLRSQIHYAHTNGLHEAGAIIRKGRAVFIHVPNYMGWLSQDDPSPQQPRRG